MKEKIKKIVTVLLMSITVLCLYGCNSNFTPMNAKSITFTNIDKNELKFNHLEKNSTLKMNLVLNNESDFSIFVDKDSKASLIRAANELNKIIKSITGFDMPIKNELDGSKGIVIGKLSDISTTDVKDDGFVISIDDNKIDIKGLDDNGSRNGVYTFMEEYLGVIFYSYDDTFITKHNSIYLEKGNFTNNPKTAWRDVYCLEGNRNLWCAKLKLNGYNVEKTDKELGLTDNNQEEFYKGLEKDRQYNEWGTWCHNYYEYLSADEYYSSHPEYFSMLKGKRIIEKDGRLGQLCLSNPDVYDIVEKNLLKKIEENPDVKYWDFSCNDSPNVPGCKCDNCKKMDKDAGKTGMGSLLPFINKLARKVKEVYPDKEIYISTLAYLHTLQPPTNGLKVEDNVVIKLCSMPGDQGSSYLNPGNKNAGDFNVFLKEWSKIAKHIVVWDYVVDFANLLMPFPNFAVQQENQEFYEQNNIQGIFHQASREAGGEMVMLRTYILSKLMWYGSTLDVSHEVSKFVAAYYKDASVDVIEYLNLLQQNLSNSSKTLGLYDSVAAHAKGYLSLENIRKYENIIDKAKEKVKDDKIITNRLESIELNIKYAKLQLPKLSKEERTETHNRVNELSKKQNITMVREWQSLNEYNNNFDKELSIVKNEINKPVYIGVGVSVGIIVLILLITFIVLLVKKKKIKAKKI